MNMKTTAGNIKPTTTYAKTITTVTTPIASLPKPQIYEIKACSVFRCTLPSAWLATFGAERNSNGNSILLRQRKNVISMTTTCGK